MDNIKEVEKQEEMDKQYDQCIEYLEDARAGFLQLDGVIGVGYGPREKGGQILEDELCFIVYVEAKKDKKALSPGELLPSDFRGIPIDVVVPGRRSVQRYNSYDFRWLDSKKIHEDNPQPEIDVESVADYDLDHVAILEIDDSYVSGNIIDFAKATKRFLHGHPDTFDFITFYVDTSTGLPDQGSYHSGIYNKTTGINYYAGSNLDIRSTFGSTKLRAYHSMGWMGNAVLLQEFGHMWGAYARNRDTQSAPRRYDLLIGSTGQGIFHWGRFFDSDHSPMDYDGIDWQSLGCRRFRSRGIADDFFHFHPLDLYLMGIIPASEVGSFYVIQDPSASRGTITGTKKNIGVQNVIWAEGERNPAYPDTQKTWKQAFVVLTKDARRSRNFTQQVVRQRRDFTWQFYKATQYLGKVDTTLRFSTLFPSIRDISVAVENDRAIIGWKTTMSSRGQVNYATSSAAFRRDQSHTKQFSTVGESVLRTSHGVQLTGLTPNRSYYFEIIAETAEGLIDRQGVELLYTNKSNDSSAPHINNDCIERIGRNKVRVGWKTDKPSDSRIYYGTGAPLTRQKYDPYPTTDHNIILTGLSAETYYLVLESRDAAGNVTRDDNLGNYFRVELPAGEHFAMEAVLPEDIDRQVDEINDAVDVGDIDGAVERTSHLIAHVAEKELEHIAETITLPEDDLEAGFAALQILVGRLDGSLEVVERGADYIHFTAEEDPLCNISCVELPGVMVACECGYPVLSDIISGVREGLILEPHPTRGMGHYILRLT